MSGLEKELNLRGINETNYSELSDTELNYRLNKSTSDHFLVKKDATDMTYEIEELQRKINAKILELEVIEKNYVDLIKEMTSRQ